MTRVQQIRFVFVSLFAVLFAGAGNGIAAQITCNAWYSGKLAGYIYWAAAPEDDINGCVQEHGANFKDLYDLAPLHHALSNPNVRDERIKLLIKSGADVNQPGFRNVTPLIMAAAYASNPAIISRLLRAGASPTHVDDWGENALGAIRRNPNMSKSNKKISEILLNRSWNIGASDWPAPISPSYSH